MGIFDRLSTMLRSNINDLISRAENPEKMLNQLIIDMKSNLAKAKQEVASAIADEKKLQADAETMRKQAEDWERRAMLAVQEGRDDLALRIAVQPGGCAGLRYNLFFDDRTLDGDLTADFGGVTLTVDRMSAPYVQGATIDFVDSIEKQGFTIDNPNATGSCACGDSFN